MGMLTPLEEAAVLVAHALFSEYRGNLEEAIEKQGEAVGIYRRLAQEDGGRHLDLAAVLYNLARMLTEAGRVEEAIPVAKESVSSFHLFIRRAGEAAVRERYFFPYLSALNDLGVGLLGQDRLSEAVKVFREAVATYRQLTREDAEVFRPEYIASIRGLRKALVHLRARV